MLTRLRAPWFDVALAAAITVVAFAGFRAYTAVFDENGIEAPATWISVSLLLVTCVPLVWRRVFPLSVALVVGAAFTALRWIEVPEFDMSSLALFVALYSAGAFGGRWRHLTRAAVVLPSLALIGYRLVVVDGDLAGGDLLWIRVSTVLLNVGFFAAAWWLGDGARRRRLAETDLRARTAELEAEREENARRAILDERVRIARELHDVVAHHVSVMGLQAGAARRAFEQDPDAAREALRTVEHSGREAVRELHQLLGFLRQGEGAADDPQPGLSRLPGLVEQVGEAGLDVELEVDPGLAVPDSVGLSAYRIVQEALTNSLRHGGALRASVRIAPEQDGLSVVVDDDGAAAPPTGGAGGHGLLGMRERAALHQGRFDAGPRPEGGWRVEAFLPVPAGAGR